jgi:hypothetical protein
MRAAPQTEMAVFRLKARQAAQHCLYFLYFLEPQRRRSRRRSGRHRSSAQPRRGGVLADRMLEALGWALDGKMIDAYRAFAHDNVRALVGILRPPDGSEAEPVVVAWQALQAKVGADHFGRDDVQPAIEAAQALVDACEASGWLEAFNHTVRKVLLAMLRNLTLILALVAVWAVFFKIEAVSSLIWNRAQRLSIVGVRLALESWSPFVAVLGSVALMVLAAPRRGARFGKHAFWAFKHQVLQPEAGIERWPPGPRLIQQALFGRQLVKLGMALVMLTIEALLMAWLGAPTTLTIFLIATLALLALVLAHALDYWDFLDTAPLRFIALLALFALFGFSTDSSLHRFVVCAGMAALAAQNLWAWRNKARPPGRPRLRLALAAAFAVAAVVVAGDLVSSRIAFLAAMTGLAVWRWQVLLERSRRSLANYALAGLSTYWAIFPISSERADLKAIWRENVGAIHRIPRPEWPFAGDDGPVVVMAASGGGSRAAIYAAYTLERLHRDLPDVAAHLQAISSVSGGSLASAAYVARRYNWGSRFGEWVAALPAGIEPGELVAAMSHDFLLPTLLGALSPLSSRGDKIEGDWKNGPAMLRDRPVGDRDTPGFTEEDVDLTLTSLAAAWHEAVQRKQTSPPFPMPLFNTCTLDQHDVVISPLAAEVYTKHDGTIPTRLSAEAKLGKDDWLTWVADRDAIYGLDKLLPKFDPSLPKAVRASANFPFGFPLVELDTRRERNWFSDPRARARSDVKLTDGGVLSNSGLWPLFPMLTDDAVVAELTRRGVLLIVVEASKMPEYTADRRDLTTLYGDLNNRNPVAQAMHRRMIEGMRARLGGSFAVAQVDITPRAGVRSTNVLTTWALDPESQQSLKESFQAAWSRERLRIHAAWDCLREVPDARRPCLDAAAAAERSQDQIALRPPLD